MLRIYLLKILITKQISYFINSILLFFVLTQIKVTKEKSRLTGIFCKNYNLLFFPEKELIPKFRDSNSFFLAYVPRTKTNLVLQRKSLNVRFPFPKLYILNYSTPNYLVQRHLKLCVTSVNNINYFQFFQSFSLF